MKYALLLILCCGLPVHANDALEQRITQLEQEVAQLKQQIETLNTLSQNHQTVLPAPLNIILSRWYFRAEKVKFNTYYALDIELTNNFDKGIKEIDARVKFSDLFGSLLYSIALGKQTQIAPGQSMIDKGTQANQRLIAEQHPLKRLGEREVKAELNVRKIVFDDDSVWNAEVQ